MRQDFLVFGQPTVGDAEISEVVDSLTSRWIGTGPKVNRFERMLEEYIGVPHVRCVSSCTAALMLGMRALGIGAGDEVILPSMTFVASANAVENVGATPVLVDCEPGTALISVEAADRAITDRTKAIMPVHMAGRPADLDRLGELCTRGGLLMIEDAAHALGAEWNGAKIGTHTHLVAFSFYVTKNITTIEGGALATRDPEIAEKVERLALHGLSLGAWQRYSDIGFKHYEVVEPGFKFNMTDIQAALGLHQLPRLDDWIEARAEVWSQYDQRLADLPLELPAPVDRRAKHARHLYQVLVDPSAGVTRDQLAAHMVEQRIGIGVHYRGVHLHSYYQRDGVGHEPLPVTDAISDRTLSLPLSPELTERDLDDVESALRSAWSQ